MNDTIYEQTIKRKLNNKEKLENLGLLAVGIVGILVSPIIFKGLFMVPVIVILLIEYFVLLPRRNIEVEYSFFNSVLEISYIYNQEKRKTKLEIDMRSAEIIAPTDSDEIRAYRPQKELDFASGKGSTNTYSIIVRQDNLLTQVIIEPDEKMLMLLIKRRK